MKPNARLLGSLVVLLAWVTASAARAETFGLPGGTLVRTIKPDGETTTLAFELRCELAPIHAIAARAVTEIASMDPNVAVLVDVIRETDPALIDMATDASELQAALRDQPVVQQNPELAAAVDNIQQDDLDVVKEVAHTLQEKDETIAFSLMPHVRFNFDWISLVLEFPLAGFNLDGDTNFAFGNLNMDASFSHRFGSGPAGFALGYGAHFYAPTGGERASTLTLANPLNAPVFMHQYFTPSFYVLGGLQIAVVRLVAQGEVVSMIGVRGDPLRHDLRYFRYGFGAQVLLGPFELHAELAGNASFKNASAISGAYAGLGFGFDAGIAFFGLSDQIPFNAKSGHRSAQLDTSDIGDVADVNFALRFGIDI